MSTHIWCARSSNRVKHVLDRKMARAAWTRATGKDPEPTQLPDMLPTDACRTPSMHPATFRSMMAGFPEDRTMAATYAVWFVPTPKFKALNPAANHVAKVVSTGMGKREAEAMVAERHARPAVAGNRGHYGFEVRPE